MQLLRFAEYVWPMHPPFLQTAGIPNVGQAFAITWDIPEGLAPAKPTDLFFLPPTPQRVVNWSDPADRGFPSYVGTWPALWNRPPYPQYNR